MKKFRSWRYECEFCGKRGNSGGHMGAHERGCTANPNRVCRIHQHADLMVEGGGPFPVPELIAVLRQHWNDEDHGLEALRDMAEGCPCCMLAAIRQSGACKGEMDEDGYSPPWIGSDRFDFKKELANLWDGVNQKEDRY